MRRERAEYSLIHTYSSDESTFLDAFIVLMKENLLAAKGRKSKCWYTRLSQKTAVCTCRKNLPFKSNARIFDGLLKRVHHLDPSRSVVKCAINGFVQGANSHSRPSSAHHPSIIFFISSKLALGVTLMSKPARAFVGTTLSAYVAPPSDVTPASSIVRLIVVTSPSFLAWQCLQPAKLP